MYVFKKCGGDTWGYQSFYLWRQRSYQTSAIVHFWAHVLWTRSYCPQQPVHGRQDKIFSGGVFLIRRQSRHPVLFRRDVRKQSYFQKLLVHLIVIDKYEPVVTLQQKPIYHLLLISSVVWESLNFSTSVNISNSPQLKGRGEGRKEKKNKEGTLSL